MDEPITPELRAKIDEKVEKAWDQHRDKLKSKLQSLK